jgi:hypothetical protein
MVWRLLDEKEGVFGVKIWARHFPAVQWEREGVFGKQSCVFFRNFLTGVGRGCSEREAHGEYPVIVIHRFK